MEYEIPELNLFMMCKAPRAKAFSQPPEGYSFRLCRRNELEVWKSLHIDDPEQYDEYNKVLSEYINTVYEPKGGEFFNSCVFVCDEKDNPVGTCFIWKAYGVFNTAHWFKVLPGYEGKGLGRALLSYVTGKLSTEDYPVFLHTHPSSYRAIKLYSDFGFELLTEPKIGYRTNDFAESMQILEKYMPEKDFRNLCTTTAPEYFMKAALSSEMQEF